MSNAPRRPVILSTVGLLVLVVLGSILVAERVLAVTVESEIMEPTASDEALIRNERGVAAGLGAMVANIWRKKGAEISARIVKNDMKKQSETKEESVVSPKE